MGVLPLEFVDGQNRESLGLTGFESFAHRRHSGGGGFLRQSPSAGNRGRQEVRGRARIDTPVEAEYYRNGGILPYVLRQLAKG